MQAEAPGWISEAGFPRDKDTDPWRQWASAAVDEKKRHQVTPWSKDVAEGRRPAARGRKPRPCLGCPLAAHWGRGSGAPEATYNSSRTGIGTSESLNSVSTRGAEETQLDKMILNTHFAIRVKFNTFFVVLSQRSYCMPQLFSYQKKGDGI